MTASHRRRHYAIDTHLYVDAVRTEAGQTALISFQAAFAPFIALSSVVAQELLAGARGNASTRLHTNLIAPFERRGRVFAPSHAAWKEAGRVLGELIGPAGWRTVTRSFVNDVLLATSCREAGCVLVTGNAADFARIAQVRSFDFVAPWPAVPGLQALDILRP